VNEYPVGKKGDGSLMGASADWKNLQQKHTNGSQKTKGNLDATHKDKKYENLASNLFGEEGAADKPTYNTNVEKAAFGSSSDWTVQGGHAKVDNKKAKVNTYRQK
jgi:hypothetical protein